jgi:hypothetical protein
MHFIFCSPPAIYFPIYVVYIRKYDDREKTDNNILTIWTFVTGVSPVSPCNVRMYMYMYTKESILDQWPENLNIPAHQMRSFLIRPKTQMNIFLEYVCSEFEINPGNYGDDMLSKSACVVSSEK